MSRKGHLEPGAGGVGRIGPLPVSYHLIISYDLSAITYQASRITYQLPLISYHLSAMTFQLSPTSYHLFAITYLLSRITYQLSAITCIVKNCPPKPLVDSLRISGKPKPKPLLQ